jgi:hypothetical protein
MLTGFPDCLRESVPGGVKPTYLKDHGHIVINPKLPDADLEQAVRIAQAEFDKVVVNSVRMAGRPECVSGIVAPFCAGQRGLHILGWLCA